MNKARPLAHDARQEMIEAMDREKERRSVRLFFFYGLLFIALAGFYYLCAWLLIATNQRETGSKINSWRSFYIPDSVTGWAIEPNSSGYVPLKGKLVWVKINSLGLRDDEIPVAKSDDVPHILFLGDSFLYNMGANQDKKYDTLVEYWAGVKDHPVKIINAGVSGFGTDQEYLYYHHKGRHLQADVVILHIYVGNDLRENAAGVFSELSGVMPPKPFFSLSKDKTALISHNYPYKGPLAPVWYGPRNWIMKCFGERPSDYFSSDVVRLHEYLANEVFQYLVEVWIFKIAPLFGYDKNKLMADPGICRQSLDTIPAKGGLENYIGDLFGKENADKWDDIFVITELLIKKLRDEVVNDGAKFGVVIIPTRNQMDAQSEAKSPWLFRPDTRLTNFLTKEGIPFLRLYDALKPIHGESTRLYNYDGLHWNLAGSSASAFTVNKWLEKNFYIRPKAR